MLPNMTVTSILDQYQRQTREVRFWHTEKVKEQLGKDVCRNLLFLHDVTGCDETSRFRQQS